MDENLLSPSNIILFGRVFSMLELKFGDGKTEKEQKDARDALGKAGLGGNKFLREQVAAEGATLARIYAFTFEGKFHYLPKPALFLVHGDGKPVAGFANFDAKLAEITRTGVVARDFAFEPDVKFWEYDKADITLRLDAVSGTFDEVLVDASLQMSARDSLVSRSDLAARSDLAVRSDMASRSDLAVRHRFKE